MFQGSVFNVATAGVSQVWRWKKRKPASTFPKSRGLKLTEEEFEFTDPELDILLEDEDEGEAEPLEHGRW